VYKICLKLQNVYNREGETERLLCGKKVGFMTHDTCDTEDGTSEACRREEIEGV
jgi:hypothetical protein